MVAEQAYQLNEIIHEDGDYRMFRSSIQSNRPVLIRVTTSRHPAPQLLQQLDHEFALADLLHPGWALHPKQRVRLPEGEALVFDDFDGQPLGVSGPLVEVDVFLDYAITIVSVVANMHSLGLLHKDLKPANILMTTKGDVRLTGFGIATRKGTHAVPLLEQGLLEGTLAYMSPEQTGQLNRGITEATDLYALGSLFYQLLTGELPCEGRDTLEWIHCVVAQVPIPPKERRPGIPAVLNAIVMKLLAKLPEDRYQTSAGLLEDLIQCRKEWQATGRISPFPIGGLDICGGFRIRQRLYGRERSSADLLASYHEMATTGAATLTLVSGYAGIGKTSLVSELRQPTIHDRGFFIQGKFEQYGRGIPYSTIAQAFNGLMQNILMTDESDIATWRERVQTAVGMNGRLIVEIIPQVRFLIGEQAPVPDLPMTEAESRFFVVFRRFIHVFCRENHPLVLFLDDLQWADAASLKLLGDILTHPDTKYLFVAEAYRDNEVSPTHPAVLAIEEIRSKGVTVNHIRLEPLGVADVKHLLADTMQTDHERTLPLAELIYEKTGGNPFFVVQFVMTLHNQELLTCERAEWRWELDRIRAQHHTENVVDFVVKKMHRLPQETQRTIQLAACIGIGADLHLLSIVARLPPVDVERHLRDPLQEGLLAQQGTTYRFIHDRVQQAAYSMIPDHYREQVHLQIARLLLERTPADEIEGILFDIVGQFNESLGLIENIEEVERVADLNLLAGRRAKASAAYRPAISYLSAGLKLLGAGCWTAHRSLCYPLTFELAQCTWLAGDLDEADRLFVELLDKADSRSGKAEILQLKSEVAMTKGDPPRAADDTFAALALFDIDWSLHPSDKEVSEEFDQVWSNLGERTIESLLDLPLMTDPDADKVMSILSTLYLPAYWLDLNLQLLVTCRMVNLSLRHGNSDASAMGYAGFGRLLGPVYDRYQHGYSFGKLAYDLVGKRGLPGYRARISDLFGISTSFWVTHVREGLEYARTSFRAASEVGDVTYACYACMHISVFRFVKGDYLPAVHDESKQLLQYVQRAGYIEVAEIIQCTQRLFLELISEEEPVGASAFAYPAVEGRILQKFSRFTASWYFARKLEAALLMGKYEQAFQTHQELEPRIVEFKTQLSYAQYVFYAGLALAAWYPQVPHADQGDLLAKIVRQQEKLRIWASQGKDNFRHCYVLLTAELARLRGKKDVAARGYDEAIKAAREQGFIHHEGLAQELAGRFYLADGDNHRAHGCLHDARYSYVRWGAKGKVRQLERDFPSFFPEETVTYTATRAIPHGQIDIMAAIKASQAISQEIVLEDLIEILLRVVMEHAGAERSVLVLLDQEKLSFSAEATAQHGAVTVSQWATGCETCELPTTLLNYVRRTGEAVALEDVREEASFSSDPYFSRNKPRAVACVPVVRQAKLVGMLYLENSRTTGAFTNTRMTFLQLLASQSAISLENARLYAELQRENSERKQAEQELDQTVKKLIQAQEQLQALNAELEQRIELRTRELQETQAQVLHSEKLAAIGRMSASFSHEFNSPLQAVLTVLQSLRKSELENGDRKFLELAISECYRMRDLILTLSDYKTPSPSSRRIMDVHASIDSILLLFKNDLQRRKININTDFSEKLPKIAAIPDQIKQVIFNLLNNAADACRDGGVITVKTWQAGQRIAIAIKDTGIGIEPEKMDLIFQPFYSTKPEIKGTGLGLSVCYRIVQNHQGEIRVESELGKGSIFTVLLPI